MKRVEIPSGDPATLALWRSLSEIADALPGEWVLVGGLMVQLHAYEHGITDVRATVDVGLGGADVGAVRGRTQAG
jgi:hypothetical protein